MPDSCTKISVVWDAVWLHPSQLSTDLCKTFFLFKYFSVNCALKSSWNYIFSTKLQNVDLFVAQKPSQSSQSTVLFCVVFLFFFTFIQKLLKLFFKQDTGIKWNFFCLAKLKRKRFDGSVDGCSIIMQIKGIDLFCGRVQCERGRGQSVWAPRGALSESVRIYKRVCVMHRPPGKYNLRPNVLLLIKELRFRDFGAVYCAVLIISACRCLGVRERVRACRCEWIYRYTLTMC